MKASRTIFLLFLVLGLGAYIWFYEQHRMSSGERLEHMRRAFDLPVDRITRIGIRTPEYDTGILRAENGWELAHPEGARASGARVQQMLSRLRNLNRGELITPADMRERGQTLADFGLAVPGLVLTLHTPTDKKVYRIGDPNPLGNALYVKEEETQNVMVVSSDLMEILPEEKNELRDRTLIPLNLQDATSLSLISTNRVVRIVRESGEWRIVEPRDAPASGDRMEALFQKLHTARIDGMVDEPDPATDYGFAENNAGIRIGTPSREVPFEITLGGPVPEDPDLLYARLSGEGGLVMLSKGLRNLTRTEMGSLRDRRVLPPVRSDIRAVEVIHPKRSLKLERTGDAWRVVAPVDMPASGERVENMIGYWREARVVAFLEAEPEAEVHYRVRFTPEDAGEEESVMFEVLKSDPGAGRALIRRGESGEVLRVIPDLVKYSPVEALSYLSRQMLHFDPERVVRVSVQREGETREVLREEGGESWRAASGDAGVRTVALEKLLETLSDLRAVSLLEVNPSSLEAYGLDRPSLRISIGLGGETPANRTLLVHTGSGAETSSAMVRGEEVVFRLSREQLETLRTPVLSSPTSPPESDNGPENHSP